MTLLENKHIVWSAEIQQMISTGITSTKALESMIGPMGHVGFVILWVHHFLSRLWTLLAQAYNSTFITISNMCKKDLVLMQSILDKSLRGTNMNWLAFHTPDQIYYSDSCPAGLGGYSNQGVAWRFKIPEDFLFWAMNNLLKYLAAIITPWINLLANQ